MSSGSISSAKPTILAIQYLRAFAALLVVFHHCRNPAPWLFNPALSVNFGTHGVDIFFVISGFVMFTAARRQRPSTFLKRRFIRVVPLYWIATLLFVAVQLIFLGIGFSRLKLAMSLLFIPFYYGDPGSEIWPVLVQGWTLNYEMFFYVIFAAAIASRRIIATTSFLVCGLVLAGLAFESANPVWRTYTNGLMLEFVAGVLLGAAFARYDFRRMALLFPLGLVSLIAVDLVGNLPFAKAAIPATLIVAGALGLEANGFVRSVGWGRLVGDASYSIYLFHTLVLLAVGHVIAELPISGWPQFLLMVAASLGASIVIGVAIHLMIEQPMLRQLGKPIGTKPRAVPDIDHHGAASVLQRQSTDQAD